MRPSRLLIGEIIRHLFDLLVAVAFGDLMHDRRFAGAGFESLHLFDYVRARSTREPGNARILQAFTLGAVTVGTGSRKTLRVQDLGVCGSGRAACQGEKEAEHYAGSENLDRHLLSPAGCALGTLVVNGLRRLGAQSSGPIVPVKICAAILGRWNLGGVVRSFRHAWMGSVLEKIVLAIRRDP